MDSFDPQELAWLVVWLASRADDKRFDLDAQPSTWRYAVPTQLSPRSLEAAGLAPQPGQIAWVVGYAIIYRRQHFHAHLVVAEAWVEMAKCVLAQDARFQLESYDQQHPWYGDEGGEYVTAGGKGVRAGP